jgi:endonuclease/exonuclease/phosphatase family metal-dependent hydrolase
VSLRTRPLAIAATVALAGALAMLPAPVSPGQESPAAGRASRRIRAEPSDLLTHSGLAACPSQESPGGGSRWRMATWNIRAARSAPLSAIAAELRAMQADVVALQEVDVRTRRTGFVDEPVVLASTLGFHHAFAASIKWDEGDYGLAVLSRWPLAAVRRHRLDAPSGAEPRIVLEVTVCAGGRPLRLFNHHADGRRLSRESGFSLLRGLVQAHVGYGLLLAGDFNEPPDGPGVRGLVDAGLVDLDAEANSSTADGGRIDYLLADAPIARLASTPRVWRTDKSDHHAVLVDLAW